MSRPGHSPRTGIETSGKGVGVKEVQSVRALEVDQGPLTERKLCVPQPTCQRPWTHLSRIVSRKTPEGETTWKYVGRDVAAIANENGVLAYERDETGQVVLETQLGTKIRYERDGMGRRTKQTTPWGETRYAYDANGDWIGLEHGDAQIRVERDAMGREVRRHVGTASEGKIGTFDQAFDPVGRLTGQRYRPGGKEDVAWWRHVQYDAVGNPTRISDSARGTKDYPAQRRWPARRRASRRQGR